MLNPEPETFEAIKPLLLKLGSSSATNLGADAVVRRRSYARSGGQLGSTLPRASKTSAASLPALQVRGPARWPTPRLSQVAPTLLLVLVAMLALYPIAQVTVQSFQSSSPGEFASWSLAGWQALVAERGLQTAIYRRGSA